MKRMPALGRILSRLGVASVMVLSLALADSDISPPSRDVQLTYTATLKNVPASAHAVDLWLPVAQDTDGQFVSKVAVVYPAGGNIATEPRYGNKIWHKRFTPPFGAQTPDGAVGAQIVFSMHRDEIVVPQAKSLADAPKGAEGLDTYLADNRLIPVHLPAITKTAADLGLAKASPIHAARATYDWLIREFTYNWKAPGAGIGDVVWACDSKTGDCSDYHSVFIALMRNAGIPADHEFGFPIRTPGTEGRIPSYHCWARFHVDGIGWIPIDASEADKHPELFDYNFGAQSANLFKFSHGRDVNLVPRQAGPALNKFIEPYAEIDGVPVEHAGVELVVTFKDSKN